MITEYWFIIAGLILIIIINNIIMYFLNKKEEKQNKIMDELLNKQYILLTDQMDIYNKEIERLLHKLKDDL